MEVVKIRLGVLFGQFVVGAIGITAALSGAWIEALACAAIIGTSMTSILGKTNGVS